MGKALRRPPVACAVISLLVLGAVLGARAAGWLQRPELIIYDQFLRWRAQPDAVDDRIVICGMTEDDLVTYGHPLDDAKLARLLENLVAANPCIVGLDMYRDLKEPRSGELYPKLAETFERLDKVLAIERLPNIKPPPALADRADRVVPNNRPKDHTIDGVYRRAYLFLEDGLAEPRESLALALAHEYLAANNFDVQVVATASGAPLLQLGKTVLPRLTPDAGGYVDLPILDYEILVDYSAPQKFPVLTFGDVLEGRIPEGAVEGRIVLVATMTESVKDSNPTPINPSLRGVIEHAMIIHQLLRAGFGGARPTTWWSEPAEIAWIGACTALGGILALCLRSPWKLAPALVLLVGAIGFFGWAALTRGVWILVAAPAVGCFVAATFVTSFIAYLERSERGVMQTLFSKHVSSAVAEALWGEREQFLEGGRLKPQRLSATVLFTDLKGFSTTSEKMDPATLLDWINEYMNGIARQVDRHGGMVNKYMGDAIMAVFGAPIAHTQEDAIDYDAIHAVECALAMRAELARLNADWRARNMPVTEMRVGIYTGPVVAGSIGSDERLEFTCLGDTVNTAARLETAGKEVDEDAETAGCKILIGDSTCKRLRGRFVTRLIGPMSLKGKGEQIIVHCVVAAVRTDSSL